MEIYLLFLNLEKSALFCILLITLTLHAFFPYDLAIFPHTNKEFCGIPKPSDLPLRGRSRRKDLRMNTTNPIKLIKFYYSPDKMQWETHLQCRKKWKNSKTGLNWLLNLLIHNSLKLFCIERHIQAYNTQYCISSKHTHIKYTLLQSS